MSTTLASIHPPLDGGRIRALRRLIKGSVTLPADERYDSLRTPWLEVIEQHPALIVDAACVADVVAAVNFARDESLALGVMATGHGIAVACDGLLLRFSKMAEVAIDASCKIATVGPGVLSSHLLQAAEKHHLAYPAGQVGNVGVVGFALGGGIGWLVRKFGAAADWIVGADVVLADGSLVRADQNENPDPMNFYGAAASSCSSTFDEFGVTDVVAQRLSFELPWMARSTGSSARFPCCGEPGMILAHQSAFWSDGSILRPFCWPAGSNANAFRSADLDRDAASIASPFHRDRSRGR